MYFVWYLIITIKMRRIALKCIQVPAQIGPVSCFIECYLSHQSHPFVCIILKLNFIPNSPCVKKWCILNLIIFFPCSVLHLIVVFTLDRRVDNSLSNNGTYITVTSYPVMSTMAFEITSVFIVCSTVGSGADQRKHQSSASLPFVSGIHRWPVNSPHKRPVTRKMFPFDDVIMYSAVQQCVFEVW